MDHRRLSDTEVLVRAGINRPGVMVAPENGGSGVGGGPDLGADNVRLNSGSFRRNSGAGDESLAAAVGIANCEE